MAKRKWVRTAHQFFADHSQSRFQPSFPSCAWKRIACQAVLGRIDRSRLNASGAKQLNLSLRLARKS
jgi:hypothetical protein